MYSLQTDKEEDEKDTKVEKENNQYPQLDLSGNYVVDNETGSCHLIINALFYLVMLLLFSLLILFPDID